MKKLIALTLALTTMFVLAGCMNNGQSDKLATSAGNTSSVNNEIASKTPDEMIHDSNNNAWTVKIGRTDDAKALSQEDRSTISDILDNGNWADSLTKCASDCVITTADGEAYNYHSTCGTFNDNKNQRSMAATDEEMKMINSILNQYGELEPDDWGLSLSAKNVTPAGATLVISQSGGNPSGELRYGSAYKIQSLNGDTWEDVPYVAKADVAWTDEAYMVEMDTDCEIVLSWDWLYGNLPEGQYRIVKQFMDFRSSGDYDKENYDANFEIK
ncbi:immunoglobulin-like domain-containing protein [uncultured Flavonifractor sp.]|uniref:immunoglobulin-like domain-containing protein n=1 Tax=uncultured Flavonifractor sp. TaxID=1193534 RepID=UPI002639BEB7|nr:immunoglobulin-like domain-containing protein [uncultured Flavonifractor sp.]